MKRMGIMMSVAALSAAGLVTSAQAGKKSKKAASAEVTVENTCQQPLDVTIAGSAVKVDAGATSSPVVIQINPKEPVVEMKAKDTLLARLVVQGDQTYAVKVASCKGSNADVFTEWTSVKPSDSPHAMAQVRFRARARKVFEVMGGKQGRFKPVSVAVTGYEDVQPGEFPFGVRMRMARRGPIVANVKKQAALQAGRKYLVEVDAVGRELFFSVEDEGLVK